MQIQMTPLIFADSFIDVNALKRAVGDHTKFKEVWEVRGDTIYLKVSNPFKSTHNRFKLNEFFEEDTMDGKKAKSIYTEENGRLIVRQQREPHNVIQCREIGHDGKMVLVSLNLYVHPNALSFAMA